MYLVTGKRLADDHDRAIRFIDQYRAIKEAKVFSEEMTAVDWCDKCNCWHVTGKKKTVI